MLTERLEQLETIIEEQGMLVKRGKCSMKLGLMNLMIQLVQKEVVEEGEEKEAKHSAALREKEILEEELAAVKKERTKQEQHIGKTNKDLQQIQRDKQKVEEELKVKMLEHKLALQEKELRIKDHELELQKSQKQSGMHNLQERERGGWGEGCSLILLFSNVTVAYNRYRPKL